MVFKPHAIQLKNVTGRNLASFFDTRSLVGGVSPLKRVWSFRLYKTDKLLSASKPVYFLRAGLQLKAGQCQRIL